MLVRRNEMFKIILYEYFKLFDITAIFIENLNKTKTFFFLKVKLNFQ